MAREQISPELSVFKQHHFMISPVFQLSAFLLHVVAVRDDWLYSGGDWAGLEGSRRP